MSSNTNYEKSIAKTAKNLPFHVCVDFFRFSNRFLENMWSRSSNHFSPRKRVNELRIIRPKPRILHWHLNMNTIQDSLKQSLYWKIAKKPDRRIFQETASKMTTIYLLNLNIDEHCFCFTNFELISLIICRCIDKKYTKWPGAKGSMRLRTMHFLLIKKCFARNWRN